MVDSPEVFISAESPYRGAKPADIAAIPENGQRFVKLQRLGFQTLHFLVARVSVLISGKAA